jgi:hypothetical protein
MREQRGKKGRRHKVEVGIGNNITKKHEYLKGLTLLLLLFLV